MSTNRSPGETSFYAGAPGREDRHGEMTGAISFNMVLVFLPVTAWCFGLGPWLFESTWPVIVVGLGMVAGLGLGGMPLSRRLWVKFSRLADRC